MGEEIKAGAFTEEDVTRFQRRLEAETALARELFEADAFSQDGYAFGFEIESWILDHSFFPAPVNQQLLERLNDPLAVPELSRFNLELNSEPLALGKDMLSRSLSSLEALWRRCNQAAHGLDANLVLIGTLPTIREEDLTLDNISPLNRYYALNAEVLRRRGGAPLRIDIDGRDRLVSEHYDVMMEAATTSFQIHLKTPARLAHRFYNASVAASGPILAACGNAPFLFGRTLWEETRIPLFEQAVVVPGPARVSLGSGYAQASCLEFFEENLRDYSALLPIAFDEPPETLRHLRLHNGVIWRWNRPLIGFDDGNSPHFRIEHRILPAGPSLVDMIANAALYLGLARHLALGSANGDGGLPFEAARANFYAAARHGLEARLCWPGVGEMGARDLLSDLLLPAARRGLSDFGLDAQEFLDIVEARIHSGRTGAAWQRAAFEAHGRSHYELMAAYCERQRSGAPAHEWEL